MLASFNEQESRLIVCSPWSVLTTTVFPLWTDFTFPKPEWAELAEDDDYEEVEEADETMASGQLERMLLPPKL